MDLDKIILEQDNNFFEDDPDTVIYVRIFAWCNNVQKCKKKKKNTNKELMSIARYPKRWWNFCMPED